MSILDQEVLDTIAGLERRIETLEVDVVEAYRRGFLDGELSKQPEIEWLKEALRNRDDGN
jgi:hypothetical protein